MKDNKWLRLLAYVTGLVNQDRRYPGRPRIESQNEALVVQMAQENSGWGGE